jgi:hypothetical protein
MGPWESVPAKLKGGRGGGAVAGGAVAGGADGGAGPMVAGWIPASARNQPSGSVGGKWEANRGRMGPMTDRWGPPMRDQWRPMVGEGLKPDAGQWLAKGRPDGRGPGPAIRPDGP